MAILRAFIDDLLSRTDIVELIDLRVPLKKAGRNYTACCPFHNEKSPSFHVSPDKQFYHCFGCGAHGNAISFLMEFDRLTFPEAVEDLARLHGLDVQRDNNQPIQPQNPQTANFYELMAQVSQFYCVNLQQASSAKAVDYLKNRGLTGATAKKFGIGYANAQWDSVLQNFGNGAQAKQNLITLGMLIQNENGKIYDRFRERIMFPIRDGRGRVIGFGGRVFEQGEPKYLNSPETPIFHKGKELYGLFEVKQAHRKIERILVVEGYMDVVALAQYGIDYAVASLGTATTSEQLQILFRQTSRVTCCYDGDKAGRGAAKRALESALPLLRDGKTLDFVFLPDGEDPDSMVRSQGKEVFEQFLANTQPLSKVLFDNLLAEHNAVTDSGKSALIAAAKPLLETLPAGEYQNLLFDKLHELVGLNSGFSQRLITRTPPQRAQQNRIASIEMTPMRKAIAFIVQNPSLAFEIDSAELASLTVAGMDLLIELVDKIKLYNIQHTGQILENFRLHSAYSSLARLAVCDVPIKDKNGLLQELLGILGRFIDEQLEQRLRALLIKERQGELTKSEKYEYMALMQEYKTS